MTATTTAEPKELREKKTRDTAEAIKKTRDEAVLSVEGIALQAGLIPVTLLRESCTPDAERLVRKLGRMPKTAEPWLPVATVGPLLIMAHHNPDAGDLWGVPLALTVRVLVSIEQYSRTRQDLVQRFSTPPLPAENPVESLKFPSFRAMELDEIFQWLLENYPYEPGEVTKLTGYFEAAKDKGGSLAVADFNGMGRNLGVALSRLQSDCKVHAYNAAEAPRQSLFPPHIIERHNVYPLFVGKSTVYLLSETPDNYAFEDEWISLGNRPVKIITVLADNAAIRETIARASASFDSGTVGKIETQLAEAGEEHLVDIAAEDMARINPQNPNHTAEELIHWALFTAIRCRASDLHIEKFYSATRFRARIDGTMKIILTAPEDMLTRYVALVKNYANMGQTRQECQDGRFAMRIGRRRVDVRVAAVPTRREFQKVIMRFLDKQDGVRRLSDFNLSQRQIDIFTRTMQRDQGLILVTGPTGSGKTTTLYALLNSVNDETINIQTIEDPIEYEIEGINQTQTNPVYNLDFANGLRALLRADPDVILIGESRDAETANAAINASLTGHLVLTTLHANDSLRAISRLLSMGVEKYLVSDSLALSQAQRLVRRLCNYCKRPTGVTEEVQAVMARQGAISQPLTTPIYEKAGCNECHGTGYSGRIALMELCEINSELRDLVEQGAPQSELRTVALRHGFRTLYQEGLLQVISGNTTMEEIRCLSYTAV